VETIKLDSGLTIAYREAGRQHAGAAVLLLHGWPTSSYLWRDVMPAIAGHRRVVAVDLPGFGGSDKPTDVRYSFGFFAEAIDGVADRLGLGRVIPVGHDLGGPIALRWALDHPGRTAGLGLLNTLVYPEFSESVRQFVADLNDPVRRDRLTSPEGLTELMRSGMADPARLSGATIAEVLAPFGPAGARTALADAALGLEHGGFVDLARRIPELRIPLFIVYGVQDRVLPDVAETMRRVQRDVPGATVTALPDAGHFVMEDDAETVGRRLAEFVAGLDEH
jgi:pimeloyl-ACP methyl ester carboxylesterase